MCNIHAIASLGALVGAFAAPVFANDFAGNFLHLPAAARPWIYWFWNNGNVTSNGVTADLEAMHCVGIGGVLIMDVAVERYGAVEHCGPPRGTAEFMNPQWQHLLQFSAQEAARLGLLLYLRPENPNQTYTSFQPNPTPPAGYRYDEISAEALIQRASANNGRLVLPEFPFDDRALGVEGGEAF
jgi:hypothetical protein